MDRNDYPDTWQRNPTAKIARGNMRIFDLGVGVLIILMGIRELIRVRRMVKKGIKTNGTIVNVLEGNDSSTDHFPVIEYRVRTGEQFRKASRYTWHKPEINQQVELYYDPNHPENIVENTTYATVLAPARGIIFGIVWIILSEVFWVLTHKS